MDWIINDELGLTIGHVLSGAAACAMVIGGVLPYVPQYKKIKESQDPEGFSLHVCLALLIANTLRIFFWFAIQFELPLLVQSVIMNVTMFLMIHLCVRVKQRNTIMRTETQEHKFTAIGGDSHEGRIRKSVADSVEGPTVFTNKFIKEKHYLSDFELKYFWQWTDFQSYLDFMLAVWLVGAIVTYIMLDVKWFMETIGFLAVFTEAMLGVPQFLQNYKNKSTHGMSIYMVIMWTCGDMFKTGYFIVRNAPKQFYICGTLQVSLDLAILLQVYIYRNSPVARVPHRVD